MDSKFAQKFFHFSTKLLAFIFYLIHYRNLKVFIDRNFGSSKAGVSQVFISSISGICKVFVGI